MQLTLVQQQLKGIPTIYAYQPDGQVFGDGGTVVAWCHWVAEHQPTWPTPIVADVPPTVVVGPAPQYGETCPLCLRRKRPAWEYRLNAIALNAFGHASSGEPPPCRLCNPDVEPSEYSE